MKRLTSLVAMAAFLLSTTIVAAAEKGKEKEKDAKIQSGLKAGSLIGAFYVTKLDGAKKDGVKTLRAAFNTKY